MTKIKNLSQNLVAIGLVLGTVACGGGGGGGGGKVEDPSGLKDKSGNAVSKKAAAGYKVAIDAFAASDAAGSWSPASCEDVASKFLTASKEQRDAGGRALPEAHYNAGLAYQRCGLDEKAKEQFNEASNVDKEFHRPRAQLALYRFKESGNVDTAISDLNQIIVDAKFQNVEGLVSLASLQMQRGGSAGGPGCNDDLACAQLNLQRALALDDSFMPAFNQLALYYLEQARGRSGQERSSLVVSGAKTQKINKQRLDLAALVASQAQKKNPNYAPIHNTTGLILVELENYNGAVKAFGRARQLNPKLFEAQMNYAAVNLSFRGFGEAAKAYQEAIKLRPNTYEAHLGLALALRGMITNENYDTNVAQAQKHLEEAKKLEPNRPEAFYNEAILTEEFRAKRAGAGKEQIAAWQEQIDVYNKATAQYESFISNASGKSEFEAAVKVSKGRIQDIKDTVMFIQDSIQIAKDDAAQAKAAPPAAAPPPAAEPAPAGAAAAPAAAPAAPAKAAAPAKK